MAHFHRHQHRPIPSLSLTFRPSPLRYHSRFRPPQLPLSEGSANLLVGTTIAACVGTSAYTFWAFFKPKPKLNPNPEPSSGTPRHGQAKGSLLSRMTNPTPEFVYRNLILTRSNIAEGRYWTLLTSTLIHGNLLHLLCNMYTLRNFGGPLAMLYGFPAYVGVWVGSGVVGGLAGVAFEPKELRASATVEEGEKVVSTESGHVGASGALMGMLAVMACHMPRAKARVFFIPIDIPLWSFMIVFSAASAYAQMEGKLQFIGHMAHLGGAACGALYYLLVLRWRYSPRRMGMRLWR